MAQWLWLRAFQTVHYRITLKIKFHFLYTISCKISLQKLLSKLVQITIFFIFYNLKRIKFHSLLTVWYSLRPSQQPTVSPIYSHIKINIGPSEGGTIIPSSHRPTILYWRLSDFKIMCNSKIIHLAAVKFSKALIWGAAKCCGERFLLVQYTLWPVNDVTEGSTHRKV